MSTGLSISAFFPAYNDEVTIQSMIVEIDYILRNISDDYEIIVVNDGSKDNTKYILDNLAKNLPKLRVIHHERNSGYGGCLKRGFKEAQKEWLFYTDGDGQYDLKEILLLLEHKNNADVVTGYKIARSDSLLRIVIGKVYHWINKVIFRLKVRDVDCDFRLIKKSALGGITFKTDTGFFPVEMVKCLQNKGCRFYEVPVHHYYRKAKSSQFFSVRNIFKVAMAMKSFWKELHADKEV